MLNDTGEWCEFESSFEFFQRPDLPDEKLNSFVQKTRWQRIAARATAHFSSRPDRYDSLTIRAFPRERGRRAACLAASSRALPGATRRRS
ncbi:hypothetical protein [Burkholderia gladioli]|uniref:hypothetical protein n=1 Tax=Burkholderia gladioli TaxID=28095 RepID=UPI0034DB33F5